MSFFSDLGRLLTRENKVFHSKPEENENLRAATAAFGIPNYTIHATALFVGHGTIPAP